ncbi:hypothetical protein P692DRAFT_201851373 [Suillus brevipes Sb2]|nr:hypothetical protein P692DRAFT_201851373 [Suillus brevipes Sb2]
MKNTPTAFLVEIAKVGTFIGASRVSLRGRAFKQMGISAMPADCQPRLLVVGNLLVEHKLRQLHRLFHDGTLKFLFEIHLGWFVLPNRHPYLQYVNRLPVKAHEQFGAEPPSREHYVVVGNSPIEQKLRHVLMKALWRTLQIINNSRKKLSCRAETQKFGQISVPAVSGAAAGLAEVDEAKAATMARATAEDQMIEEESRRTDGLSINNLVQDYHLETSSIS